MERPIVPHDPLFQVFYFIGYFVLAFIFAAGAVVTYDWWKEKKEKEKEEGENG